MKRKYIIPQMTIEAFAASSSILAGSPSGNEGTGGGGYNAGDGTSTGTSTTGDVSGTGTKNPGLMQHSKQFDAWSTWDE